MIPGYSMSTVPQFLGRELGISSWVAVDQDRIDQFAACTGDKQWIHVDVERARRESPFGGPIAHGYLTLSLVPQLSHKAPLRITGHSAAINYGAESLRFLAPVPAGAKLH